MKNQTNRFLTTAAFAAAMTIGCTARAQAPAGKSDGPVTTQPGLDFLDERDVYVNLIKYKLTDLAKVDMELHKLPAAQQEQMFALADLNRLKTDNSLTPAQRRTLAVSAANGLLLIMAKETDYKVLNDDANDLVAYGIAQTVDELDYFGDNPEAQKQLQPVADTAKKLYAKASDLLGNQLNVMGNQLNQGNANVLGPKLQKLGAVQDLIDYSNNMTSYALCISYPAGDPQRKVVADAAIKYLTTLDNPDQGVQSDVKIAMGKLLLATGDFAGAHKMFDAVISGKDNSGKDTNGKPITPPPTVLQQNTARFFSTLAELQSKDFAKADTDDQDLEKWQSANLQLANDPGTANAIAAAMGMLKFRINSAQADAAGRTTPRGKSFNDKAITALVDLLNSQKGNVTLQALVYDQIRGRIGANPDYKSLDILALMAIRQQGFDDYTAMKTRPVDPAAMQKAIDACREIAARQGQPGVSKDLAETSALFIGFAEQFALKDDMAAAAAYIDYLTNFKSPLTPDSDAQQVFNNCSSILGDLKKRQDAKQSTPEEDDKINQLFDRFLPLVFGPPYDQKQLAFLYGKMLYGEKKWSEAAKILAMVTPDNPSAPTASVFRMEALGQSMNDPGEHLNADQRKAVAAETVTTAAGVQKLSLAAADAPKVTADDKKIYLERALAAAQVSANLQRSEMKDPKAALASIDDMEKIAGQMADPDRKAQIHITALKMRCTNYMAENDTADAVKTVKDLLAADPKAGQALVVEVDDSVEHDLISAQAKKDTDQIKSLTVARSELTGEIVNIIAASKDPKVQAQLPAYRLYDAESKRQAAELLEEGPQRTAALKGALGQYTAIINAYKPQKAANDQKIADLQAQLRKTPDAQKPAIQAQLDPLVDAAANDEKARAGAGLVSFDLGDYQTTMDMLGPLIRDRHTGSPTQITHENGVERETETPGYWEAFYKYYQACVNVTEKNKGKGDSDEVWKITRTKVANTYTLDSKIFGGSVWKDQCMALLLHLKPDALKSAAAAKAR
jgi:hypothetical protein